MSRAIRIALLACAAGLASCSPTVPTVRSATSRFPSPTSGGRLQQSLCLPAARNGAGLAERATWEEHMATCARAARAEGVDIAGVPGQPCLHAEVTISSRFADRARATCAGGDCSTSGIFRKKLRMLVRDPQSNEVLLETVTIIDSTQQDIFDGTVYALCTATFRGYPQSARNVQQSIELPRKRTGSAARR